MSEVNRRQEYLDKMTGGAVELKPLVMSCLDDNPANRPSVAQVSVTLNRIKDIYSQISPVVWWAEVSEVSELTSRLVVLVVLVVVVRLVVIFVLAVLVVIASCSIYIYISYISYSSYMLS